MASGCNPIECCAPAKNACRAPSHRRCDVAAPSHAAINKLAAAGKSAECIEALRLTTASRGAGDFASAPLDTLLELAKEDLKAEDLPPAKVETTMKTCDLVLGAIRDCLPPDHSQKSPLTAKAQNRRGDCLLLLGKAEDALTAYNAAIRLSPEDAYPVYNRGRAHLALGHKEEAKADFTTAASGKFKQTKARKLAQAALEQLP